MRTKSNKELWWITRVLSGLIIAFSLFMFIGETFFGEKPGEPMSNNAILQLSIGGIGLIGLGLAWKWELTGGIIALVAFIVLAIINPITLQFPLLYIYPVIAILFIVLWAKSRETT
jgi:asparagine N-glycosylation enzyme membrane subunit Stt3